MSEHEGIAQKILRFIMVGAMLPANAPVTGEHSSKQQEAPIQHELASDQHPGFFAMAGYDSNSPTIQEYIDQNTDKFFPLLQSKNFDISQFKVATLHGTYEHIPSQNIVDLGAAENPKNALLTELRQQVVTHEQLTILVIAHGTEVNGDLLITLGREDDINYQVQMDELAQSIAEGILARQAAGKPAIQITMLLQPCNSGAVEINGPRQDTVAPMTEMTSLYEQIGYHLQRLGASAVETEDAYAVRAWSASSPDSLAFVTNGFIEHLHNALEQGQTIEDAMLNWPGGPNGPALHVAVDGNMPYSAANPVVSPELAGITQSSDSLSTRVDMGESQAVQNGVEIPLKLFNNSTITQTFEVALGQHSSGVVEQNTASVFTIDPESSLVVTPSVDLLSTVDITATFRVTATGGLEQVNLHDVTFDSRTQEESPVEAELLRDTVENSGSSTARFSIVVTNTSSTNQELLITMINHRDLWTTATKTVQPGLSNLALEFPIQFVSPEGFDAIIVVADKRTGKVVQIFRAGTTDYNNNIDQAALQTPWEGVQELRGLLEGAQDPDIYRLPQGESIVVTNNSTTPNTFITSALLDGQGRALALPTSIAPGTSLKYQNTSPDAMYLRLDAFQAGIEYTVSLLHEVFLPLVLR